MDQGLIEHLKKQHAFDSWKGRNALEGKTLFVWKFFLAGDELSGWKIHRSRLTALPGAKAIIQTVWTSGDAEKSTTLRTDISECDTRLEAHETLIRWLADFQSPVLRRQQDAQTGDVLFVGPQGSPSLFARGNLAILFRDAGGAAASVSELAQRFDTALIAKPEPKGGPDVRTFRAVRAEAAVDENVPLEMAASDPADRPVGYKVFAEGGDLLAEPQGLVFRGAKPGRHTLMLVAWTSARTSSTARLEIAVK